MNETKQNVIKQNKTEDITISHELTTEKCYKNKIFQETNEEVKFAIKILKINKKNK